MSHVLPDQFHYGLPHHFLHTCLICLLNWILLSWNFLHSFQMKTSFLPFQSTHHHFHQYIFRNHHHPHYYYQLYCHPSCFLVCRVKPAEFLHFHLHSHLYDGHLHFPFSQNFAHFGQTPPNSYSKLRKINH